MAPVEPEVRSQSNSLPLALFSGQILLVAGLTTHLLLTSRRAARALPPPTSTRTQEPVRKRHAIAFSILAFLSLASVTTFAVLWRAASYLEWAERGNHITPGSLWTGWYGTGGEVGRWHLGDWISDVDLIRESDAVAVQKPEGFYYTSQHFVALVASAIFMGVEGHRRNLSSWTIASFVLLSATGSLGYALNLFFITVLYTPLAQHSDDSPRHNALFTPKPIIYLVPIVTTLLALYSFPTLLAKDANVTFIRLGYVAVPLFFAFAPSIIPTSWGSQHTSKTSAHHSYGKAFHALSMASFLLYWVLFVANINANTPPERSHIYDILINAVKKQDQQKPNRLLVGISSTARNLKHISRHPAISVTSVDVFLTTVSLLAWTFTRSLDVEAILENSILSFLAPKHEKHVAFEDPVKKGHNIEPDSPVQVVTPRRRGRPKKSDITNGNSSPSSTGSVRRSTRRKTRSDYESDAESTYEPSTSAKNEVTQTESDGATSTGDIVRGGESTALGLFLVFAGGLGQLAAGALGAEVAGSNE